GASRARIAPEQEVKRREDRAATPGVGGGVVPRCALRRGRRSVRVGRIVRVVGLAVGWVEEAVARQRLGGGGGAGGGGKALARAVGRRRESPKAPPSEARAVLAWGGVSSNSPLSRRGRVSGADLDISAAA